ncbi:unnamed protein product [Dibothriocephalus latus]|uniref:Uncharacterized protein n=1 Tax=Dibothriocephalus latus TaxID=60516 RepID=A0A3P6TZQ0_DIBLA|nr:unnamed protein product [Dibothriocephalus latus]
MDTEKGLSGCLPEINLLFQGPTPTAACNSRKSGYTASESSAVLSVDADTGTFTSVTDPEARWRSHITPRPSDSRPLRENVSDYHSMYLTPAYCTQPYQISSPPSPVPEHKRISPCGWREYDEV